MAKLPCYLIPLGPKYPAQNIINFLRWGVVSTSPNHQAGGPPLVGCSWLLIQYIRKYICRQFLHPQPEDAPCRGDRDSLVVAAKERTRLMEFRVGCMLTLCTYTAQINTVNRLINRDSEESKWADGNWWGWVEKHWRNKAVREDGMFLLSLTRVQLKYQR